MSNSAQTTMSQWRKSFHSIWNVQTVLFSFLRACILASQGEIIIVISDIAIQAGNVTERICRSSQTHSHSVCSASTLFCTSKTKCWLFTLASGCLGMHVKWPFKNKILINNISLAAGQLRYLADAFSSSLVCLYNVCKAIQGPSVLRLLGYSPNLHEKSIPSAFTKQELLFTEALMSLPSTFLPCMPFLCLGYKCKHKFPVAQLAKDQTQSHTADL